MSIVSSFILPFPSDSKEEVNSEIISFDAGVWILPRLAHIVLFYYECTTVPIPKKAHESDMSDTDRNRSVWISPLVC